MANKKYLIKVTYVDGNHAGTTYLMRKGGYVTREDSMQFTEDCYASLGFALRECRRLAKANEIDVRIEDQQRAIDVKRGRPLGMRIHDRESYEPYEIPESRLCMWDI